MTCVLCVSEHGKLSCYESPWSTKHQKLTSRVQIEIKELPPSKRKAYLWWTICVNFDTTMDVNLWHCPFIRTNSLSTMLDDFLLMGPLGKKRLALRAFGKEKYEHVYVHVHHLPCTCSPAFASYFFFLPGLHSSKCPKAFSVCNAKKQQITHGVECSKQKYNEGAKKCFFCPELYFCLLHDTTCLIWFILW